MLTIHITIERERDAHPSREGARFRVKLRAQPGGPALMMSTRLCQSVSAGKREANALFGALDWRDADGADDVRSSTILEIEDGDEGEIGAGSPQAVANFLQRDPDWCYTCDRPKNDCGCVENGGTY